MLKQLTMAAVCLLMMTGAAVAGEKKLIPAGSKVFVRELGAGLESYLKAEILKKKIPVTVVNDEAAAEFVISGTGDSKERKWHEGFFTRTKDNSTGAIELSKRDTAEVIWAAEAGDRDMWWGAMARDGQRKVAGRLVDKLKNIVGKP